MAAPVLDLGHPESTSDSAGVRTRVEFFREFRKPLFATGDGVLRILIGVRGFVYGRTLFAVDGPYRDSVFALSTLLCYSDRGKIFIDGAMASVHPLHQA